MPGIVGCLSVHVTELPGSRSCRDVTRARMHPCRFSPASWLQVEKTSWVPRSSSDVVCPAREPCALRWGHHLPSPTSTRTHCSLATLSCNQHEHTGLCSGRLCTSCSSLGPGYLKAPYGHPPAGGQPPPVNLRLGTSSSARQGDEGKLYFPQEGLEPKSRFMILHYSKKKKKKKGRCFHQK